MGHQTSNFNKLKMFQSLLWKKVKKKTKEERAMATYRNARTKNWLKFIAFCAVRGGTVGVK